MEGLAPLLFFVLIGLVQLLVRWLRAAQQRQQQQQQQRRPPSPQIPMPEEATPEDYETLPFPRTQLPPVVRVPAPPPSVLVNNRIPDDEELMIRRPVRPAAAPAPARRRPQGHPRLGSRSEVRRAIVLMEILGPPRAAATNEVGSPR